MWAEIFAALICGKANSKPLSWGLKNHPLVIWRMVNLDRGPHVSRLPRRVWRLPRPRRCSKRQNPTAAAGGRTQQQQQQAEPSSSSSRSWSACNKSRGEKWEDILGCFFSDDFEDGDGCFDRFRMIFRELETDILNGFQESVIDFRELGPTQHETSSLHTFCFFNWIA